MPTLRAVAKEIMKQEELDPTPGAWPIMFRNDWARVRFIMLLRWLKFWRKVKRLCHL